MMVKMPVLLPWKKLNVHFPTFLLSYLRQNITRQPSHLRNLTLGTVHVVRWHLSPKSWHLLRNTRHLFQNNRLFSRNNRHLFRRGKVHNYYVCNW